MIAIWLGISKGNFLGTPPIATAQVAGLAANPNHPVEIYYGSPQLRQIYPMLTDLGIEVYPEDKISAFPQPFLGMGSRIEITRALAVDVVDAGKLSVYRTWAKNVEGLLSENHLELLGKDTIEPALETDLTQNMTIKITRVSEVEETIKEEIDYKVTKKNDANLEKGQTKIEQKGAKGTREVKYLIKRVDGVEISRKKIETKVTKEPVNEIQIIGIGPKLARSGPYVDIINAAAKKYLINGTALMCLMLRESNGHNTSVNPNGPYYGLFQYTEGFWNAASAAAGFGGADWSDPTAQIYTTAYELAHGQGRRWPPWSSCANK